MKKLLKSKLLSQYPEIDHGIWRGPRAPYFRRDLEKNHIIIDENALFKSLNLPAGHSLVVGEQEHTDEVFVVRDKVDRVLKIQDTDALITNHKNVHLLVYTADCMPILMYDPVKKVIAAAHSGWKGTVNKIAVKVIKKMEEEFGTKRQDVIVYIGPSIGPCCYKGNDPIRFELFKKYKNAVTPLGNGESSLNLWGAAEDDLIEFGVPVEHIENAQVCTFENGDKFASHRREQEKRVTTNMTTITMV